VAESIETQADRASGVLVIRDCIRKQQLLLCARAVCPLSPAKLRAGLRTHYACAVPKGSYL
jgi:hypothetical protein